jgi:uncharacterized protein YecT (DUF1311 family)
LLPPGGAPFFQKSNFFLTPLADPFERIAPCRHLPHRIWQLEDHLRNWLIKHCRAGRSFSAALLCLLLLGAWPGTAHAQTGLAPSASFDCTKANGPDEQIICASGALEQDDSLLASSYQSALAAFPDATYQLKLDERAWIRTRDAMCHVTSATKLRGADGQVQKPFISCFLKLYQARTLYLQALAEPTAIFPGRAPGVMAIFTSPGSGPTTINIVQPPPAGKATPPGMSMKLDIAQSQLTSIVARISALYPHGFSQPSHTDMTCKLARQGVFPPFMMQGGPCIDGVRSTYPRSPWGSPITIYAPWADNYDNAADVFQVDFQLYTIIPNPCADLIGAILKSGLTDKMVRVYTARGPTIDPKTPAPAAPACFDAGFDFRL